jgi:hypothetical protein
VIRGFRVAPVYCCRQVGCSRLWSRWTESLIDPASLIVEGAQLNTARTRPAPSRSVVSRLFALDNNRRRPVRAGRKIAGPSWRVAPDAAARSRIAEVMDVTHASLRALSACWAARLIQVLDMHRSGTVDPALSGVAETLLIPLYNRAMESQRPDAMMKDEKAVALVTQMRSDVSIRYDFDHVRKIRMFEANKVARIMLTREMDRYTRDFLNRVTGQIV